MLDQLVDAYVTNTAPGEQLIGAVEDPLASFALTILSLLALTCAGNRHDRKLPLDRSVCLCIRDFSVPETREARCKSHLPPLGSVGHGIPQGRPHESPLARPFRLGHGVLVRLRLQLASRATIPLPGHDSEFDPHFATCDG